MSRLQYILEASARDYTKAQKALIAFLHEVEAAVDGGDLISLSVHAFAGGGVAQAVYPVLDAEQCKYLRSLLSITEVARGVRMSVGWFEAVKKKFAEHIETAIELVRAVEHWGKQKNESIKPSSTEKGFQELRDALLRLIDFVKNHQNFAYTQQWISKRDCAEIVSRYVLPKDQGEYFRDLLGDYLKGVPHDFIGPDFNKTVQMHYIEQLYDALELIVASEHWSHKNESKLTSTKAQEYQELENALRSLIKYTRDHVHFHFADGVGSSWIQKRNYVEMLSRFTLPEEQGDYFRELVTNFTINLPISNHNFDRELQRNYINQLYDALELIEASRHWVGIK